MPIRNSSKSVEALPSGSSLGTGEKAFTYGILGNTFAVPRRNGSQGFFLLRNHPGCLPSRKLSAPVRSHRRTRYVFHQGLAVPYIWFCRAHFFSCLYASDLTVKSLCLLLIGSSQDNVVPLGKAFLADRALIILPCIYVALSEKQIFLFLYWSFNIFSFLPLPYFFRACSSHQTLPS